MRPALVGLAALAARRHHVAPRSDTQPHDSTCARTPPHNADVRIDHKPRSRRLEQLLVDNTILEGQEVRGGGCGCVGVEKVEVGYGCVTALHGLCVCFWRRGAGAERLQHAGVLHALGGR
jgi:hypothetical protein